MYPHNEKQFFEGSIHLIFAVVVAQGFTIAGQVFLPITNLYSYDGFLSAFSLVFAYFFTITAWYGFFKSVKTFPHVHISRFTITRYGIAIFNAFILYYMISLAATKDSIAFSTLFLLVIIYFLMIIIIHVIKSVESLGVNKIGIDYRLHKTLVMTLLFLIIFVVLIYGYEYLIKHASNLKWDEVIAWNPIFLTIFFLLCAWYRWIMWKERYKTNKGRV